MADPHGSAGVSRAARVPGLAWCRRLRIGLVGLAVAHIAADPRGDEEPMPRFEPTSHYETRSIEGWTVLVSKAFLARQPDLADEALELLGHQLYQITRSVPAGPARVGVRVRPTGHPKRRSSNLVDHDGWLRRRCQGNDQAVEDTLGKPGVSRINERKPAERFKGLCQDS